MEVLAIVICADSSVPLSPTTTLWPPPETATVSDSAACTKLVAASDSSDKNKAQANYVCDGISDEREIETALAALPAAGGQVVLLEGTFSVSSPINLVSNSVLSGQKALTVIKLNDEANCNVIEALGFPNVLGSAPRGYSNITIRDFQIDDNRTGQTKEASATCGNGIKLQRTDRITIQNCFIFNCLAHAIAIRGVRFGDISKNFIWRCENSHGIDLDCAWSDINENITISSNYIKDSGYDGIKTESSHHIVIQGNIIEQAAIMTGTHVGTGISIAGAPNGSAGDVRDVRVVDNIISGSYHGISITDLADCIVLENNTVYDTVSHGISINNYSNALLIRANLIARCGGDGINMGGNHSCKGVKVEDNAVLECAKSGIYAIGSTNCEIDYNRIESCADHGVYLDVGCHYCSLIGNNVRLNNGKGIYIFSSDRLQIVNNCLSGNKGIGLELADCQHCVTEGNTEVQNGYEETIAVATG